FKGDDGAEAGVENAAHRFLPPEIFRDASGIGALPLQPQRQSLDAAENQKAIVRTGNRPHRILEELQFVVEQFIVCNDATAQAVAVTIDVLGGGVNDDIGAKGERLLQDGRGESIV